MPTCRSNSGVMLTLRLVDADGSGAPRFGPPPGVALARSVLSRPTLALRSVCCRDGGCRVGAARAAVLIERRMRRYGHAHQSLARALSARAARSAPAVVTRYRQAEGQRLADTAFDDGEQVAEQDPGTAVDASLRPGMLGAQEVLARKAQAIVNLVPDLKGIV